MTETYGVRFEDRADLQLGRIQDFISGFAGPNNAASFAGGLLKFAQRLNEMPHRGHLRDDLFPGLRVLGYKKRAVVLFTVDDATRTVSIVGVYYGGQNWEADFPAQQASEPTDTASSPPPSPDA